MLDLDQYMNNSVKIKLFGKEYDVFEPTVGMILEMDQLEADLSEDNVYEKRIDACLLLINHNRQGREFTADEIKKLPLEAVIRLIAGVANSTGTMLPETGGIGTVIFVALGALAVICAGVFLVTNKRMSKESF